MSMHIKPLTPIEEAGLRAHCLPVGTPSQLADAFRLGMAWADKARAESTLAEPKPDADGYDVGFQEAWEILNSAISAEGEEQMTDVTKDLLEALKAAQAYVCGPTAWTQEQEDTLVEAMSKAIARAEAALAEPQPDAGLIGVQWWLAELDLYGNPALADGAHSDRAGADKAMHLFKALHLDAGRRFAVARVELSEPKPRGDGVNHEAIKTLNDARREAQP